MSKERILVVDDEEDILELVRFNLAREGYHVTCAATGEQGLAEAVNNGADAVVLDLMLPGIDGLELCKRLKGNAKTRQIPIVMLTAKGEEADIVTGLELGADDYVTKPFSPKVLTARVKSVLRRKKELPAEEESLLKIGELTIDAKRHEVLAGKRQVELTFTEFAILQFLARRPGIVFTRYQIVDSVKGSDYPVTDRSVDVQIVSLRRKLGAAGKMIETVRGVGYKFRD